MKIRIFQVSQDRDANRVKFCGLEETEQYQGRSQIDPAIYDEVFNGEVDCKDLEQVYEKFNLDPPPLHRGHSVSVSDVILTDGGAYFCDSVGFQKVEFDPALTRKPENLLHCVMAEPGKPAYEAEITDSLRAFQQAVRGNIEVFCPFEDNAVIICNEEGKIDGLPQNRTVHGEPMVGNLVIVGDNGDGNFCSLTDAQIEKYLAEFQTPEFTDPDEDMDSGIQMT